MKYDPTNPEHRATLARELSAAFSAKGYKPRVTPAHEEEQLALMLKKQLQVRLYTSVVAGGARAVGEDAIRVCLVYLRRDGTQQGLAGAMRVNRVGEIQDIVKRAVDRAAALVLSAADLPCCRKCGSPLFTAKSGKEVCAEFCWKAAR